MNRLWIALNIAVLAAMGGGGCSLLSTLPDPQDIATDMCELVFAEPARVAELEQQLGRDLEGFGPAEVCEIADVILPFLAQVEQGTTGGAQALGVSAP